MILQLISVYIEIKNLPKIKVKHAKTFSLTKQEREKVEAILQKKNEEHKKFKKLAPSLPNLQKVPPAI